MTILKHILLCVVLFAGGVSAQTERKITHREEPDYPELAKKMNLHGTVKLKVWISPDGTVSKLVSANLLFPCGIALGKNGVIYVDEISDTYPSSLDGGVAVAGCYSDTPLFQGMKSSWASSSALVRTSPLATFNTNSNM